MLRFAICEDVPYMMEELAALLSGCLEDRGLTFHISGFSDGRALLESRCDFDLILLDIRMEGPDGLETAQELRRRGCGSLLIFVTALEDRALDAFDVDACGYLVKPLDPDRFRRTMDRALRALEQRGGGSLLVQKGRISQAIPLAELVYCEVQGRRLYLHRADGTVADCCGRLEELEQRVDGRFFRCHRSYLVGLDHVRGQAGGQILLSTGERIPLSRLRERAFTQALLRRMKGRAI